MRTIISILAGCIVFAQPAVGRGLLLGTACTGGYCVTTIGPSGPGLGGARAIQPPISDQARTEAADRDARWVAYCRPTTRQDRYGVERYVYAHEGCEYGRSRP